MPKKKGTRPVNGRNVGERALLKSEKRVLHGLVGHPLLNDRELAQKIGMKMSTLTAIKNRLKENDMFYTVRVPNFAQIGNELMIISANKVNPLVNIKHREKVLRKFIISEPSVVFHIMGTEYDLSINIARNYTEARRYFDQLELLMSQNDLIETEGNHRIYFSFEMTSLLNFFDFSSLLGSLYDLEGDGGRAGAQTPEDSAPEGPPGMDVAKLTAKERNVLYGLVKYPDLPDKAVASKMDVTRQTVNRLKKEFEEGGLIKTMRIPNINRIGAEIIVFSISRFNPEMTFDKRRKGIQMVRTMPQILQVSSDTEAVNLFLVSDFKTYQELKDKVISFYKKHEYFSDEPLIILFSIESIQHIKNHVYADLLAQSLGIDVDAA